MPGETIPPRDALDTAALAAFLQRHGWPVEFRITQYAPGHSNLTYLLETPAGDAVLRCPPRGPLAPKAHDMAREARFLAAIHPHYPLAPRPLLICEDSSVWGFPFYLMERRPGVVLRAAGEPADQALRPRVAVSLVKALAELHQVDVRDPAVAALGRPEGFLARQLAGWSSRWERVQTAGAPAMANVQRWLAEHMPAPQPPVVLHNDFKIDNVVLSSHDLGRVVAVLDWEMAALGDPMIDLGILLCYWPEPGDPPARRDSVCPVTAAPGWPSREELVHRYALLTGRDVSAIAYYEVFGLFKLAVVLQQIYYRHSLGHTSDPRFAALGQRVHHLIACAGECTGRT
jgi:aminoglycoside phosphotransferase (APT) family kinase protein